jgi:hypothetical protein
MPVRGHAGELWFRSGEESRVLKAVPMSTEFGSHNPYATSQATFNPTPAQREQAPGSLLAPAMALVAVAGLGLAFSIYGFAMSFGVAHVDPSAPEMVRQIQEGTVGPVATALQGGFAMLNLFIIICGVQMMRLQSWGMAVAGSVLAMLNIGSCCCAAGVPVGIWSLAVLMTPDIISIFSAAQTQPQR